MKNNNINHEQRASIDLLCVATARIHRVARRKSHVTAEGRSALHQWHTAQERLLAGPNGQKLWLAYCNLYQYNVKSVALDFFT